MASLLDRVQGQRKALYFDRPYSNSDPYEFLPWRTTNSASEEVIENSFEAYVEHLYKGNGIVAACIGARMLPFSEVRFQFQQLVAGRPGRLFGTSALGILEAPWANATTGDLLSRMEQDASLAGNSFLTVLDGRIRRLRPDWVKILSGVRGDSTGSPFDLGAEILGYVYHPDTLVGGHRPDPIMLTPERVVHYAPMPDPMSQWRGMSWLTPIIRDIQSDTHATRHKLSYFENGTALNVVIKYDSSVSPADLPKYKALFDESYRGSAKAYQTLHLGGGADASVLGADLKSIDFKAVQGAGETRIAAAAGVGAIIARLSEGMQGSSLNSGNYGAAKRQFGDMTIRPLWRSVAGSLATIVDVPAGARLWYDARDVEFLKEDRKDAAEILQMAATTIRALVDAGYEPDAVIDAVEADDLSRLTGKHSGLYSVQLQEPGSGDTDQARALSTAEQLQKIYLAVGKVITADEARALVGIAGGFTPPSADGKSTAPPMVVNNYLPEQKAPTVTVEPAVVNVSVPEQKAPTVTVEPAVVNVTVPDRKSSKRIEHDEAGRITRVVEED